MEADWAMMGLSGKLRRFGSEGIDGAAALRLNENFDFGADNVRRLSKVFSKAFNC